MTTPSAFFLLDLQQVPARLGTDLATRAQKGGVYPLLVIGGIILLIVIFVIVVQMKRDD